MGVINKLLVRIFPFFTLAVLFSNCTKKEFEEYYARPENLEPPIYQSLQGKGNFTHLLALIDKGGYKTTLSSAGYWTMFAPNDAAFEKYFQEKGIAGVNAIDSTTAQAIVQYMLVYNAFNKDRIDDYQANSGWMPDLAYKRRTAYYTGFYNDTTATGDVVKATASNRNGGTNYYNSADNNNKYIPFFTDGYFASKSLSGTDYNYFFPNTQYTGFNVVDAKVVTKDIPAENGVIHEIDKVIAPLPSIEQYLRDKPEFSEFKKLYNKYMVQHYISPDATRRYQILTGSNNQVYVKVYSSLLAFSPNNENYMKLQDNDGQQDGYTLFVPKNDVLLTYVNSVILEHFKTFDNAPPQVLADFLNAHMWQTTVWPSKFSRTFNFLGEEARFDNQADVFDRKVLSNGLLYGTNKVQEANVFSSVYAKAYLDPKFSIMTRLLDVELKFAITNPKIKYTVFMMPDAVIRAAGYNYDAFKNEWQYTPPVGTMQTGEAIRQRLLRILNTSVVQTQNNELNNLTGSGIAEAYNGEFIKYNNNQVFTAGTMDAGTTVRVDSVKTSKNGVVYYLNRLLTFSEANIGTHIKNLAPSTTSDFYNFWKFLESSAVFNAATGEIIGTSAGSFYTVFIPNNAAIVQAVKDGVLPGNKTTGVPTFNPTDQASKDLVSNFISYHILNKRSLIPNGGESGGFETLLKNNAGDVLPITVLNQPGAMQVTDMNNRKANVIVAKSNNLSTRTVIHLTDNYLKYKF